MGLPAGAVLCYPVISTDAQNESLSHRCVRALTEGTDTAAEHLSLEKRVTEHTPPCFLWATSDDDVVSVTHTLKMGEALRAHHVPFAMHIYPSGRHGLGLADSYPDIGQWKEDAVRWMQGFRK